MKIIKKFESFLSNDNNLTIDSEINVVEREIERIAKSSMSHLVDNGYQIWGSCKRHGNTINSSTFICIYRRESEIYRWEDIKDEFISFVEYLMTICDITGIDTTRVEVYKGLNPKIYTIDDILEDKISDDTTITHIYIRLNIKLNPLK